MSNNCHRVNSPYLKNMYLKKYKNSGVRASLKKLINYFSLNFCCKFFLLHRILWNMPISGLESPTLYQCAIQPFLLPFSIQI